MTHDDGRIDAAMFDEAARARAQEKGTNDDTTVDTYFLFRLSSTGLAVPAVTVESVADVVAPMRVPHTPSHILGLVLHGEVARPIVDLAAFLGLERDESEAHAEGNTKRVVFVRQGEMVVGLMCDRASGVSSVKRSVRAPPEVLKGGRLRTYLEAELEMTEGRVGVLDLARFIEDARVRPSRDDPRG